MPKDFSRICKPNWIGRQVAVCMATTRSQSFIGTLVSFEDGWLKLKQGTLETWFSPSMPITVTLEEENGQVAAD